MKKLSFIPLSILYLMALLCFSQCKKEKSPPIAKKSNIVLYNKPVEVIQGYIQGKWRLQYAYGGICGTCKYNKEAYNEYYEFGPNLKIVQTSQDSVLATATYKWVDYQMGPSDNIHHIIEYGGAFQFEAVKIINDTLVLATPFLGNPDYQLLYLTKSKSQQQSF